MAVIDDIAIRPHDVDVKTRAGRDWGGYLYLIAQQGPVRSLKEPEQSRRLRGSAPNGSVGRTITGHDIAKALRTDWRGRSSDYTTVSRQVAKLESLGLVERRAAQADRRVREAIVTGKGREMTDAIDQARDRIMSSMLADWSPEDIEMLARLIRRLADAARSPDA